MVNDFFVSERLLYRHYREDDIPAMVKRANEPSQRRWFYFQEPDCLTEQYARNHVIRSISTWNKEVNVLKDECDLAVVLKETGELIGGVGVAWRTRPEVQLNGLEIGFGIAESHQCQGYATEAAKAAIEWAIKQLHNLGAEVKIGAYIEHNNVPSRKVVEKVGFTYIRCEEYVSVYEIYG